MDPLLANRLVFVLGLVNLFSLLALFFSCRCMAGLRLYSMLSKYRVYTRLYRYHCYYWVILGLSVAAHLGIAISVLGIPFGS